MPQGQICCARRSSCPWNLPWRRQSSVQAGGDRWWCSDSMFLALWIWQLLLSVLFFHTILLILLIALCFPRKHPAPHSQVCMHVSLHAAKWKENKRFVRQPVVLCIQHLTFTFQTDAALFVMLAVLLKANTINSWVVSSILRTDKFIVEKLVLYTTV